MPWVLAAVCLAGLAMPLSFTGPAVVLPLLREALGGSPVGLHWATNAFMLSFGAALMAAGALADNVGRRRVFLGGLLLAVASGAALACAPNLLVFNLLRGVQGLAAAAALAGGSAALAQVVQGTARTRAFGWLGASFGAGLAFGPLAEGLLGDSLGWRAVVLLPGLVSVSAFAIGAWRMPASRSIAATRLDGAGTLAFTLALGLLTLGVLQAPAHGWGTAQVVVPLAGAALAALLFVRTEARLLRQGGQPMLDMTLFRYPRFVGVQLLAAAPAYGFVVLLVLLPIRFIGLEGRSSWEAGQLMLLLSGPILLMPGIAARLVGRWSAAAVCAAGLVLCAAGLLWLGRCGPATGVRGYAGPLLAIGLGVGLPWGLMDGLAVSVVPRERAGMAAGIFNTVRVAGEGIALALVGAGLGALLADQLGHAFPGAGPAAAQAAQRLATGDLAQALALLPGATRADLLHAYALAFGRLTQVLAGVTLATAGVVFLFLRTPDLHGAEGQLAAGQG
ncbi:MFS transporter [Pseudorhodoferax soli]|uniref:MFS transporter n=1 Tax=Pseudorhodoferax soli TaxID=545864 RepID=A0A368Y7K3_9BURK|nr:MFS transporter [Pseudorhodoferax soli]